MNRATGRPTYYLYSCRCLLILRIFIERDNINATPSPRPRTQHPRTRGDMVMRGAALMPRAGGRKSSASGASSVVGSRRTPRRARQI